MPRVRKDAKCGVCGAKVRRMYPLPKGGKARIQHPRWMRCEGKNKHKLYRKG